MSKLNKEELNKKQLMFDFFYKYIHKSNCIVKKKDRFILPRHCNPEGYFMLHKDKYPWNKWDLQELKYHLEARSVDNPQPKLMDDLNEFCKSCTAKDINTAADLKDSKPRDDDDEYSSKLRKKRRSKKRRSKKKKSRNNSKRRKYTKRRR